MAEQKTSMLLRNKVIVLLMLFGMTGIAAYGAPGKTVKLVPVHGGRIWLSGTSTLHPYTSIASNFTMTASAAFPNAEAVKRPAAIPDAITLSLTIPVTNLKCEIGGLDNNLYEAMKYREIPNITFTMLRCELTADPKAPNRYTVTARGSLSIAGKEREITLNAVGELDNKTLRINGKKDVLMTDFGITPPSLMFGLIVCGDKISVGWELIFTVSE